MKILITSGPTRAPLDAMRFISNRSTGRFGVLLAREALRRGAQVTFIYGRGSAVPKSHPRLRLVAVETNAEVANALRRHLRRRSQSKVGGFDAVIHAMALLDFQPAALRRGKTPTLSKRGDRKGVWNLKLVPTPKIISQIKKWAPQTKLVGFKLEIGVSQAELLRRARRLLRESHADYVLANQLTEGCDSRHAGILLDRNGRVVTKARGKENLAKLILRNIGAVR